MELQQRIIRRTIHLAVRKAMEDIKGNPERSIRNLIDLGRMFAKTKNQAWFFDMAKNVFSNPQNPYRALAKRVVLNIDNETVRTVGLNLGHSSLIHGAKRLKRQQGIGGIPLPWVFVLDLRQMRADAYGDLNALIRQSCDLGVFTYVICADREETVQHVGALARHFKECAFLFKLDADLILDDTLRVLEGLHNAVISVKVDAEKHRKSQEAFRLLRKHRCLYGFHLVYEENADRVASRAFIRQAIEWGNLFGVYIAGEGVTAACREKVYAFVCQERGGGGQPLIALEWARDLDEIGRRIGVSRKPLTIRPPYSAGLQTAQGGAFMEMIGRLQQGHAALPQP